MWVFWVLPFLAVASVAALMCSRSAVGNGPGGLMHSQRNDRRSEAVSALADLDISLLFKTLRQDDSAALVGVQVVDWAKAARPRTKRARRALRRDGWLQDTQPRFDLYVAERTETSVTLPALACLSAPVEGGDDTRSGRDVSDFVSGEAAEGMLQRGDMSAASKGAGAEIPDCDEVGDDLTADGAAKWQDTQATNPLAQGSSAQLGPELDGPSPQVAYDAADAPKFVTDAAPMSAGAGQGIGSAVESVAAPTAEVIPMRRASGARVSFLAFHPVANRSALALKLEPEADLPEPLGPHLSEVLPVTFGPPHAVEAAAKAEAVACAASNSVILGEFVSGEDMLLFELPESDLEAAQIDISRDADGYLVQALVHGQSVASARATSLVRADDVTLKALSAA